MENSEANSGVSSSMGKNDGECQGEAIVAVSEGAGSFPAEEALSELLKNTPTNIARLEDVIEQCKGRQKYLAQTKSSLDGEDIRWYFCKVPLAENELAASIPRAEIVGKSKYFRFSMRDSLALEASFLQREEELLSVWWKEYAECSEGPSGSNTNSGVTSDAQPKSTSSEANKSTQLYDEERVGVPVKGGLYEVDLAKRHCFPVYWNGENRRVLRGHWFARKNGLDWLPMREDIAEQLEFAYRSQVWHRRTFQPSGLFAARIDLQGTTQGLHALFTGEDDTWEAWLGVDTSGFSNVIGLRGNRVKVRRGFSTSGSLKPTQDELRQQKEEEMDDYCSQVPVRHLVFMVHGIGQRLEKANLVDDVSDFRHITASLAERHLTSYQRNTQRVLFIPCQWRRGLKLSGESAVEKITLDGVRGLRVTLSATVHDVLYYMSPIYCQDIINSVSNQLNMLYMKFIKRNPGYDGKVSIYGHSLGSVLSYDILCHQESLFSPFPMQCLYTECVKNEESVDAANQSTQSENKNLRENGETSNELLGGVDGENLSPHSNKIVQEENTEDHSFTEYPSPTSDVEGDPSKTFGNPSPEEANAYFQQIVESNESNDASSFEEDAQKLAKGSSNMFSQDGKSLDEGTNVSSQVPDGDGDTLVEDTSEDISDRDKLITLLMEEVNALKARIAELESRDNSLILSGGKQDSSLEFHQEGDKVDSGAPRQSVPGKPSPKEDDSRKSYTPHIKYTKLEFKADTFFAVGSPLGVFLALRNIRIGIGKGQEYWQDERISEEMPACRQMFNIFHPFDPVAYRVEPLVCKEYISKRPVIIPYHRGGKRLHIGFQEFAEDLAARSQAVVSNLSSVKVKMLSVFQSRKKEKMEEDVKVVEERTYGSIMMERLTGSEDGQIDHMLQDKTFEHAYISAIGAHTNYWRDPDTALFILKHLYRNIPEEPEQPNSPGSSGNHRRPAGPIYQSDAIDEDLPLTFSDKALIREFSRKAKKVVQSP
ncbi:phospholipase SGR2 isoform X3 [Magnolia sinica]|uniref:phospholipase SGR2 isoform X3 n=1 Tax=Magnolia sinica TaxID=86752 RepID=UPI0026588136|nr:phospholipase SGR2 isoform X3 [Magnolia sinica]